MPGFKASDGQKAGLEIWRVEKMEVNNWPEDQYGSFYSGDCYVCLKTVDKPTGREQDIYFWLGKECSQDEQGVAAYKTVELDDMLGGAPVQHRETQGHESKAFLALFKNGIKYLEGGIESGFKHVDRDAYEPKLLHLKGKRNVRVMQVELSGNSLNEGDVFVLDCGLKLYQWNGGDSNKYEKFEGMKIVNGINNDERGGKAEVTFMDSGKNETDEFWAALGGKPARIKSADEGGDDAAMKVPEPVLFGLSDASGSMEITEVARACKFDRDLLNGDDVFLLDGGTEIFVWVGKKSSKEEKQKGMSYGMDYLSQSGRPSWTPITRLMETGETQVFKSFFGVWDKPKFVDAAEKAEKRADDVGDMYQRKAREAEDKMAPTNGSVQAWRVENFAKVPVPESELGQFHAGDSFLLLYSYETPQGKEAWIIYFWQGRDSSQDEKACVAKFAVDLDDELGGDPVQVRVTQGKEPNHFLTLFQGRMIVHEGGVASGFKNRDDVNSMDTDGISLFHVRGTTELNTRAVQVAEVAGSLNSGDVFVLLTPGTMYVWYGKGANAQERTCGMTIANILKGTRGVMEVNEGEEPEAFWSGVGGQGEYASGAVAEQGAKEPRLFQCSNALGYFKVEEIFDFVQDDLIQDDIMLLDTYECVYVWIGNDSNREERDKALDTALNYVEQCGDGRDASTPVFRIAAGAEPITFTCNFLGWDASKAADFTDPYLMALAEQTKAAAASGGGLVAATRDDIGYKKWEQHTFEIEDLANNKIDNVDPAFKEMYLSDSVFQECFKMDKETFSKLAQWKRKAAKLKFNLF